MERDVVVGTSFKYQTARGLHMLKKIAKKFPTGLLFANGIRIVY